MRGTNRHIACLAATNEFELDAPYGGGTRGDICFRQTTGGAVDAWVDVNRGQMICHFRNCTISVKFDDGEVLSFRADRPSDGTSTMLFVADAARFLEQTRAARRIMVEAEFYRAGPQQMVFDHAEGLVWNPTL